MKRLPLLLLLILAVPLAAQEAKQKSAADEMMAMYVEMAKPVAEHKRITDLAGKWNVTTKLWFDPSGEPMTSTGTGVAKPILGGRFVQFDTTFTGPKASDSMTIFGFDRRTGDYTMVGYDTLGTYYITAAGEYEAAANRIRLDGSYLQPPTNAEVKYRFDWTLPSGDESVMTLYFTMPDGKEMRVAETTMRRMK